VPEIFFRVGTGDRSITPGVDPDRAQVWKAPDYSVSEFHANYVLPIDIGGARLSAFAHVFNLFDQVYVQDATDNSSFNAYTADGKNHKADDAEVYLGLPRTFNIGVQIEY
jgi:iron complex outermembrane receptor protein